MSCLKQRNPVHLVSGGTSSVFCSCGPSTQPCTLVIQDLAQQCGPRVVLFVSERDSRQAFWERRFLDQSRRLSLHLNADCFPMRSMMIVPSRPIDQVCDSQNVKVTFSPLPTCSGAPELAGVSPAAATSPLVCTPWPPPNLPPRAVSTADVESCEPRRCPLSCRGSERCLSVIVPTTNSTPAAQLRRLERRICPHDPFVNRTQKRCVGFLKLSNVRRLALGAASHHDAMGESLPTATCVRARKIETQSASPFFSVGIATICLYTVSMATKTVIMGASSSVFRKQ